MLFVKEVPIHNVPSTTILMKFNLVFSQALHRDILSFVTFSSMPHPSQIFKPLMASETLLKMS